MNTEGFFLVWNILRGGVVGILAEIGYMLHECALALGIIFIAKQVNQPQFHSTK